MRPVLQLSYKYLDTSTGECALYLNFFPGLFGHESKQHCTLLIIAPSMLLGVSVIIITNRSLLDIHSYTSQSHYKLHQPIQRFLMEVEMNKSSETAVAC